MQDDKIVELYWQRNETAIKETAEKYEHYLMKIADNILNNYEDCKECVNDTYLKTWNSIPPHRPSVLSTYLGKITRQTAIDVFRKRNRAKRRVSEYSVALSELEECISSINNTEHEADLRLLATEVNIYLRSLPNEMRNVFVERYYFIDSIKAVAMHHSISESKVKSMLHRTRKGLRKHLEKEGFIL